MTGLTHNSVLTRDGLHYSYYTRAPEGSMPYILLLHGFPDTALIWQKPADYLATLGYGIIAPDLLGFGNTDKPADVAEYSSKKIASHLIDILDKEKVSKVVVAGYDWGTLFISRLGLFYPDRVCGHIFTGMAYIPPSTFDMEATNVLTKSVLGYENWSYWQYLGSPEAQAAILKNPDSFVNLLYTVERWKDVWCPAKEMQEWIEAGKRGPTLEFCTDEFFNDAVQRICSPGFTSSLNWYKAYLENIHWNSGEKDIPPENYTLKAPALVFSVSKDDSCPPRFIEFMKPVVPNLTIKEIDCSHWTLLEKTEEWCKGVGEWLKEQKF